MSEENVLMTRKGEKTWFPCSFGETQKHHVVVVQHICWMNWQGGDAVPQSRLRCGFPPRSEPRTSEILDDSSPAERPDTQRPFRAGHGNDKTDPKSWARANPPVEARAYSFPFNGHFDLLRCLHIYIYIYMLYNQFSSNFLLPQTWFPPPLPNSFTPHPSSLTYAYLFPSPISNNS